MIVSVARAHESRIMMMPRTRATNTTRQDARSLGSCDRVSSTRQNLGVSIFSRLTVTNRSQTFGQPPSALTQNSLHIDKGKTRPPSTPPRRTADRDSRFPFTYTRHIILHAWRCGCRFVLVPLVRSSRETLQETACGQRPGASLVAPRSTEEAYSNTPRGRLHLHHFNILLAQSLRRPRRGAQVPLVALEQRLGRAHDP